MHRKETEKIQNRLSQQHKKLVSAKVGTSEREREGNQEGGEGWWDTDPLHQQSHSYNDKGQPGRNTRDPQESRGWWESETSSREEVELGLGQLEVGEGVTQ